MGKYELLLGDEAIALGAIHAGVDVAYSYPGTPASEILEYIEKRGREFGVKAYWSANEKVAYEQALGLSFAGKRALVSMKHVGLNVAMDPFVNSAISGVHGEVVVAVADDPGMYSSQNEQDTRYLAEFAMIPYFEPSDQQECYDMTRDAFRYSGKLKLPVLIRVVTANAHSRSEVIVRDPDPKSTLAKMKDRSQFLLMPPNSRRLFRELVEKQKEIVRLSEESRYNILDLTGNKEKGIITSGVAYNYLREVFHGKIPHPFLRVGMYPVPEQKLRKIIELVDEIYVVEEGYPFLETITRRCASFSGKNVHGKLDGVFPRTGALNPTIIAKGFGMPVLTPEWPELPVLPPRPPQFCRGCPHADTYTALNEALSAYREPTVLSDIGCYTLGFYPPYNAIESDIDMGASIGMAIGASQAGLFPVVAVIGESTFTHSGMTGVVTAVKEKADITVLILDNRAVAMTGGQESMHSGDELVAVISGLGVPKEHIRVIVPLPKNKEQNVKIIREEIEYHNVSVIISRRDCIHVAGRR